MSNKKSNEEFLEELKEKYGDEYTTLEDYKGSCKPIEVRHNNCGHTYMVRPTNLLSGIRTCPECKKLKTVRKGGNKKSTKEFSNYVTDTTNGEYFLKSEYINDSTKIKMYHLKCDSTYEVSPSNFIQGYRCPICSRKARKNTNSFAKELDEDYKLISEYINNKKKVSIKHNKCGKIFKMRPNDFQQGHRCPYCSSEMSKNSVGVQNIREYLEDNLYAFKEEVTFPDCFYKNKLRFDFVVYDVDEGIFCIIEYDGKQHFSNSFGSEKKFKEQQLRDSIKNQYCEEHNIDLIRINYKENDSIKDILDNVFND